MLAVRVSGLYLVDSDQSRLRVLNPLNDLDRVY